MINFQSLCYTKSLQCHIARKNGKMYVTIDIGIIKIILLCKKIIILYVFNFIQQMPFVPKACDRYRGLHFYKWGMNVKGISIQWGFNPQMNEVKPPADVMDFLKGSLSSELDKNPDANSTGEFDIGGVCRNGISMSFCVRLFYLYPSNL